MRASEGSALPALLGWGSAEFIGWIVAPAVLSLFTGSAWIIGGVILLAFVVAAGVVVYLATIVNDDEVGVYQCKSCGATYLGAARLPFSYLRSRIQSPKLDPGLAQQPSQAPSRRVERGLF
jgi:hypothetical protein